MKTLTQPEILERLLLGLQGLQRAITTYPTTLRCLDTVITGQREALCQLHPQPLSHLPTEPPPHAIAAMAECYDPTWGYPNRDIATDWAKRSYTALRKALNPENPNDPS